MSHNDRMNTATLHALLYSDLGACLRFPPDRGVVDRWTNALNRALGDGRVERARLLAALDRAAADRSTRNERGDLLPADVIAAYGRVGPSSDSEPIWQEYCERGCRAGLCTMIDPGGYEVVVPCDCAQGEHRQRTLLICRRDSGHEGRPVRTMINEASPHVGDCLREGWRLLLHERLGVSAEQAEWANEQFAAGRKLRDVLAQLRTVRAQRAAGSA